MKTLQHLISDIYSTYQRPLHGLFFLFVYAIPIHATENDSLPVFDAHIHYSHDVWEAISPKEAVRRLQDAGIVRAMVSSSSDEGTQRLYAANPQLVYRY